MWNGASSQGGGRRLGVASALSFPLCCLFLFLTLTGCAGVDPVVKIGLVGPFEGRHRALGYDVIYSARLAVREMNRAGGVAGYRVGLVSLDDSGQAELAAETAASLALDPAVVAVVGHWLPQTTAAAAPVYAAADLPLIAAGQPPFAAVDPEVLPVQFHNAYEAVTPFDETAGPHAAPAYDAFMLLKRALEEAEETTGTIDRQSVTQALFGLEYEGLTGVVYQP